LGTAGKEFELTLRIRSTGRASRGIRLAAGGEALARGLVQLVAIVGDGTRVAFGPSEAGMRRADLPAMAIPSGVVHPFAPAPATDAARAAAESALAASHVEIRVVARGIRPGGALLTLSVSALGSSAPPLRRIRPLNIR
ncbi:MAG: hypothetical protein KC486_26460, partial [Myxococcales bacterium]|nr:hypothetical protein [Myxococcales bacterium]